MERLEVDLLLLVGPQHAGCPMRLVRNGEVEVGSAVLALRLDDPVQGLVCAEHRRQSGMSDLEPDGDHFRIGRHRTGEIHQPGGLLSATLPRGLVRAHHDGVDRTARVLKPFGSGLRHEGYAGSREQNPPERAGDLLGDAEGRVRLFPSRMP